MNRVAERFDSSTVDKWQHVPGARNPADFLEIIYRHPPQEPKATRAKKDIKIDSEFYSLFSALGLFYIFLIVFLIVFLLFLMAGVLGPRNYEG